MAEIKFEGGTYIALGWQRLLEVYNEEFGQKPRAERPKLLALIITDGQAEDIDQFAQVLSHLKPLYLLIW
jgi:histidyl-tRNA synthetase